MLLFYLGGAVVDDAAVEEERVYCGIIMSQSELTTHYTHNILCPLTMFQLEILAAINLYLVSFSSVRDAINQSELATHVIFKYNQCHLASHVWEEPVAVSTFIN